LNSFVNFRLTISDLRSCGHDPIFVSTKPAAGQNDRVSSTVALR